MSNVRLGNGPVTQVFEPQVEQLLIVSQAAEDVRWFASNLESVDHVGTSFAGMLVLVHHEHYLVD